MLVHDPDHPLVNFYPRSPCGERLLRPRPISVITRFLSTLSLRRATRALWGLMCCTSVFLSTLSLRRATHIGRGCGMIHRISIHALLAESDNVNVDIIVTPCKFLSTLSLRRATTQNFTALHDILISIHALLAESDLDRWLAGLKGTLFLSTLSLRRATWPPVRDIIQWEDFYPRSPCGERLGLDGRFKL